MTNKYDQGFSDRAIINITKSDYSRYSRPEKSKYESMDDEYKAGYKDAENWRPRNKSKSELANDIGYQSFLEQVRSTLGLTDISQETISVDWVTGGQTGGSCWDEGEPHHYPVSAEEPEELEAFDKILEVVAPDLTFFNYKAFRKQLIHNDSYTNNEYYGNYYEHAVRYVSLHEMYECLKDKGLIK